MNAPRPLTQGGDDDSLLAQLRLFFPRATAIRILAAFAQDSGLELLHADIESARARGASVKVIAGDYLAITQVHALRRLLDWTRESEAERSTGASRGPFEARVVESAIINNRSFHPKCWRIQGNDFASAWVGSSNISRSALQGGIEWNLRVDRERDPVAYQLVVEGFEAWWDRARRLDEAWIDAYAERVKKLARPLPPWEEVEEKLSELRPPHDIQIRALAELSKTRADKRSRALVVMATGLGKTQLAALDFDAFAKASGRPVRALFLAHRAELLTQAADTFRKLRRDLRISWCVGDQGDLSGDLVLASVQKLSRSEQLDRLRAQNFDYVVVDEVHHADAKSYRAILSVLDGCFVLGLTATPERADEGDVAGLFDDHIAFRADIGEGVQSKLLVPFHYYGVKDTIEYRNIPWRNRRFDPVKLAEAVETEARMNQLWRVWEEHPATRTLVFCVSITHARFAARWLMNKGVSAVAVHSEPDSADREDALRRLRTGELPVICTVDLFNEGVDVPDIDRVVMLRPTESPIIFLQQLGRGLRVSPSGKKTHLTVIDFVGNHRSFLEKIRTLASLGGKTIPLQRFIDTPDEANLPVGCRVEIELEAKELLRQLAPKGGSEVQRVYREIREARDERPRAGELFRMNVNPAALKEPWFDFVRQEGDLVGDAAAAVDALPAWFASLQTTPLTKSFKMITLEVLLDAGALHDGMDVAEIARRARERVLGSPELAKDVAGVGVLGDPRKATEEAWTRYWRGNPIAAWTGGGDEAWFTLEDGHFRPTWSIPNDLRVRRAFDELTAELVDYRLAQYRRRAQAEDDAANGDAFECRLISNNPDPILKLPSREKGRAIPEGETDVRLPDGAVWSFRLMKQFCNVARPAGTQRNQLPDLMRSWFGPTAGRPGTSFSIRFSRSPDGWNVAPVGAEVVPFLPKHRVRSYPSLRAAAGAATGSAVASGIDAEELVLPMQVPSGAEAASFFAVRAEGDSMEGGKAPIRDGDWLVMRFARSAGVGALEGRVALVELPDRGGDGFAYVVKRVVREGDRWLLRSDNPARPSYDATEQSTAIALLSEVVSPESLAPPVGTWLSPEGAAKHFALSSRRIKTGRLDGHLFVIVDEQGLFTEPDRLTAIPGVDRRPGETAFVFTRLKERAGSAGQLRYCGVARWSEDESSWRVPALDHDTWRALGSGRSTSHRLPHGAEVEGAKAVEEILRRFEGKIVELNGRRARVVGRSKTGGVEIEGADEGFARRTVSALDISWVVVAEQVVARTGGVLDEARVNRLRYLEGTPKASTRWIDTGWALRLVGAIRGAS